MLWFLCRRRPFCCRLSAGLCVPAGQLDAEDPWPVMSPVNKCLLACLCPVSLLWPSEPPMLPCHNPLWGSVFLSQGVGYCLALSRSCRTRAEVSLPAHPNTWPSRHRGCSFSSSQTCPSQPGLVWRPGDLDNGLPLLSSPRPLSTGVGVALWKLSSGTLTWGFWRREQQWATGNG